MASLIETCQYNMDEHVRQAELLRRARKVLDAYDVPDLGDNAYWRVNAYGGADNPLSSISVQVTLSLADGYGWREMAKHIVALRNAFHVRKLERSTYVYAESVNNMYSGSAPVNDYCTLCLTIETNLLPPSCRVITKTVTKTELVAEVVCGNG